MAQAQFKDTAAELVAGGLTQQHVQRRVADWRKRVQSIYALIRSVLDARYEFKSGQPVEMHEDPMREFGLPAETLPSLSILMPKTGERIAEAYPRGLWIIGANGRIDFDTPAGLYVLNDRADIFGQPDWRMAPVRDRGNEQPVTKEAIAGLFRARA